MSHDLETRDTEPLTPDAARILELMRQIERLKLSLDVEEVAHGIAIRSVMALELRLIQREAVFQAALALGRRSMTNASRVNLLNALDLAVHAHDTLQPKG